MSLRLPLLACLIVLGVLGLALWRLDGPQAVDGTLAPGPLTLGAADSIRRPTDLPRPPERGPVALADGREDPPSPVPLLATTGPAPVDTPRPQATASISGRVFDSKGTPLADVPLRLLAEDDPWRGALQRDQGPELLDATRSDKQGRFTLAARAGLPQVLVAGGERRARLRLDPVAAGDELQLVLPEGLSIWGQVVEQQTGRPVPDAIVAALGAEDRLRTASDGEGRFQLAPLPPGPLLLGAWAPGRDMALAPDTPAGADAVRLELPPGRQLSGLVRDADSNSPIAGAVVSLVVSFSARRKGELEVDPQPEELQRLETVSDSDGRFVFQAVPSRLFRLEASAAGYAPTARRHWRKHALKEGEQVILSLHAERLLSGRVFDGADGPGLSGVRLALLSRDAVLSTGVSGADGTFELTPGDVQQGEQRLVVRADDDQGRFASELLGRKEDGLHLFLASPIELDVLVLSEGQPVPGAQVALISADVEPTLGSTDAKGLVHLRHRLGGADTKRVNLEARGGSHASLPLSIKLADGLPEQPLVIELDSGPALAGRVLDPLGQAVAGALVVVRGGAFCRSDGQGRFSLSPVPSGLDSVQLSAEAPHYHSTQIEVAPDERDVVLVLEPVVSWSVHVTDAASGLPLQGVGGRLQRERLTNGEVDFVDTPQRLGPSPAGRGGEYQFDLPGAGRYRLGVAAPGRMTFTSPTFDFDGARAPAPLDVVLFRAAMLELELVDGRGRPVPGARVGVLAIPEGLSDLPAKLLGSKKLRSHARTRDTDARGVARFNLGQGGLYRLTNGKLGWLQDTPVLVRPGPVTRLDLRLPLAGGLWVSVRDGSGRPLGGASVSVRSRGNPRPFELRRKLRTPAGGEAALIDVLPQASYQVTASARGFARAEQLVWVPAGQLARLSLTLKPAGARPRHVVKSRSRKTASRSGSQRARPAGKGQQR